MSAGYRLAGDHPGLQWLRAVPGGSAWLDTLDATLEACARQWALVLERPYPYAFASLALAASTATGGTAVLKVQFPDDESEHERAALACWAGDGAVRLLDADPSRRALLLERCDPGTPLAGEDPRLALDVLATLVDRLAVPVVGPFRTLESQASRWAAALERYRERSHDAADGVVVDAALAWLADRPSRGEPAVLLHQDLHAGNVLRARREPWLAIDPKPLVGERAFAVAPVVRGAELGHDRCSVRRRLDAMVSALGVDRDRAAGWTIVQTLAWGIDDDRMRPAHLDVARWLLGL